MEVYSYNVKNTIKTLMEEKMRSCTNDWKRPQTTNGRKRKKKSQDKRPHMFQSRNGLNPPSTVFCRLQQITHKLSPSHTHAHTHTQGVLGLTTSGNESEKTTSPAHTVPSCVWSRASEAEWADVPFWHRRRDLQAENRSLYSHNEVSSDQKQI